MTSPNPQEGGKPDWRDYGPWETCGASIVRTQFIQGDPTRPGFIIADLHSCPIDQREEISRLIAAAPALLEALRGLVPTNMGTPPASVPDDQILPVDMTVGELRKALAALLQATGGENGR